MLVHSKKLLFALLALDLERVNFCRLVLLLIKLNRFSILLLLWLLLIFLILVFLFGTLLNFFDFEYRLYLLVLSLQ